MNNVSRLVQRNLCFQCGACSVVCPAKCIEMKEKKKTGLIYPFVEEKACIDCNLCLSVCPINNLKEPKVRYPDYSVLKASLYRSTDVEIYANASSGGFVTAIIRYMLDCNIVSKALIVEMDKDNPLSAKYVIRTKEDNLIASAGSKYQHPPLNKGIFEKINGGDKIVIVGLPCHIQGMLNLVKVSPKFKQIELYTISLLCTIGRGLNGTRNVVYKELKNKRNDIVALQYRHNNFPGEMTFTTKGGVKKSSYVNSLKSVDYLYMPKGCLFCNDLYGNDADISVGDPWGVDEGKNSLVFFNKKKFINIVGEAEKLKIIKCIKEVTIESALKTQLNGYKYKLVNFKKRFSVFKMLGVSVPEVCFDYRENPTVVGTVGNMFLFLNSIFFNSQIGSKLALLIPSKIYFKYRSMILKAIMK